jgi:hypothetical protein
MTTGVKNMSKTRNFRSEGLEQVDVEEVYNADNIEMIGTIEEMLDIDTVNKLTSLQIRSED